MADAVDRHTRSKMMAGIRAKDTRPEIFLRKSLHCLGFRFRLHAKAIPGTPDIVLPKYKALIIIHGCFWHGHGCRYCKTPKTNTAFWEEKIQGNRLRDERTLHNQMALGWRCLIVWECALRPSMKKSSSGNVVEPIAAWLMSQSKHATIGGDCTRTPIPANL